MLYSKYKLMKVVQRFLIYNSKRFFNAAENSILFQNVDAIV